MWTQNWRDQIWGELDRPWDLIVIGGGITGAGILREAARAGLRALLVEAKDFASGTSSRSSKLVHGGLRYLAQGQLLTTLACVHERQRLLREGKGLITSLGFLYAFFEGDKLSPWVFGAGLAAYDLMGVKWRHRYYQATNLRRLCPYLTGEGLRGGYRYFDAQTDDARLVLRLIRESLGDGGMALNYVRAQGLLKRRDGRVCGVILRDQSPDGGGRTAEAQAAVVINATGPWADRLHGQAGGDSRLRRLRGSHLIFPASRLPLTRAISYAHPRDQRPVFGIPWEGVTLFGTTDVDHRFADDDEPSASVEEVDYLLAAAVHAFPQLDLARQDVQATFAGVRAVVDTGRADPSRESREHVLWDENGLLTVTGGKLTTFRVMALDALKKVYARLPGRPRFRRHTVLEAPGEWPQGSDSLDPITRLRLTGRYAAELPALAAAAAPGELSPIGGSLALWAELRWAARAEGVVHLDDLLLRRVRLGLLLPEGGVSWLPQIQSIVQAELGWDDDRWRLEAAAYRQLWRSCYALPES
jgi:glycerol-3-phosphate dehydrogenase